MHNKHKSAAEWGNCKSRVGKLQSTLKSPRNVLFISKTCKAKKNKILNPNHSPVEVFQFSLYCLWFLHALSMKDKQWSAIHLYKMLLCEGTTKATNTVTAFVTLSSLIGPSPPPFLIALSFYPDELGKITMEHYEIERKGWSYCLYPNIWEA